MTNMSLRAFGGDAAVRAEALKRLEGHVEARQLTAGALFWNGEKCSPSAGLVDAGEPELWQERLGLAPWLAYALDATAGSLPAQQALGVARRLLEAIRPSADTTRVGSHVVGVVLDHLARGAGDVGEFRPVLERLQGLHRRVAGGQSVAGAEWRAVRKQATAATDAAAMPENKVLGACVEAAAWDPATSPASAGDVLSLWLNVVALKTNEELGWTPEDDAEARAGLSQMHEKYIKGRPDEKRDVFMLLREHQPELEAKLLAYTKGSGAMRVKHLERIAGVVVDAVGAIA